MGKRPLVAIVGTPNVGKSVLFNALTGAYVVVSNYPGTTVEVTRGRGAIAGREYDVLDTPGMYSLLSVTAEERVARGILLERRPDVVLHVIDAKNVERMLPMTLQLIEAGQPVILVANVLDEAEQAGVDLDLDGLAERLGIAVVGTVGTSGQGVDELRREIDRLAGQSDRGGERVPVDYGRALEGAIASVGGLLTTDHGLTPRAAALLLLQDDHELLLHLRAGEPEAEAIESALRRVRAELPRAPAYIITLRRQQAAQRLLRGVVREEAGRGTRLAETLSRLCLNPWTGVPIVLIVLYFGLYQFVGRLGAGVLVDWLEGVVFGAYLLPPVERFVTALVPGETWSSLFVGDYGVITLGLRYAVAIVLPVVGTFFLFFSVLEDSGYFPRLALLVDRVFKRIGLNGRAALPLVLGFGCDTMATMVTRVLETRRERIIATMLLALAIPCSAQLGLFAALLSRESMTLFASWAAIIGLVFLLVGTLAGRLIPGRQPSFYMEVPPLRWPQLGNVLTKTYTRMHWYLREVLPLFVLASVLIWIGQITGVFDLIIAGLLPLAQLLGFGEHSPQVAEVFLFGFFRRDYSAAHLFDLQSAVVLSNQQLLVGAVTLTLFMPCIAQFLIMRREHGWGVAIGIALFALLTAFTVGALLNLGMNVTGIRP